MDFDNVNEIITPTKSTSLTISGTGALFIPAGTVGERPVAPQSGYIRFNTSDTVLEYYNGVAVQWQTFGSATLNSLLSVSGTGMLVQTSPGVYAARSIAGTTNRVTLTNGDGVAGNPTVDISSSYVGQATITTLGTVGTGTWNATTIAATVGGTGQTVYAVGDILYANTTTTLAKLADIATGNALISGGVSTAPSWGKIGLATHVSGTLPIANGGTNLTTLGTANQILGVNAGATALEYKTVTAGTAISVTNGAGSITIANTGVTSNVAGTGISVSGATGAVTITNTGVTSAVAGTGISVSGATGAVTFTNTGATSIAGTTNQITASAATGAITLSTPTTFTAPGYVAITTGLYESTTASVTAAGATQGTATALTTSYNVITTAAAGTGVILPTPLLNGWAISIVNRGANAVNVYPNTGGSINGGVANAPFVLTAGNAVILENSSTTAWFQTSNVASAGTGTVTSVGLALPSIFTVSGSPVISAGTLTGTLVTQANNTVFAGPATGGPLAPTFRTLSLDELNDVTSAGATTGQYLLYDGTTWVPYGGAGTGGGLRTWSGGITSTSGTSIITPAVAPPLSTAGTLLATQTLTPLSTSSRFTIQIGLSVSASTNNNVHTCSVFRGTTYIGGAIQTFSSGGNSNAISICLTDAPATVASITYTIRYGTDANTWYVNRRVAENTYGGVRSGFEIQEY